MILIVGQSHSSLVAALKTTGHAFYIMRDSKRYDTPDAIDFNIEEEVLKLAKSFSATQPIAIAMYEQYIPICAKINQILGNVDSLSFEAALRCTDKVLMRQAFNKLANISPEFSEVKHIDEAKHFIAQYGYPVIIKPANLSKSMLIQICRNEHELETAFSYIATEALILYKKYTLGQTPRFIIEEFMEGSLHTVAAFVDNHGNITFAEGIVDNTTALDVGYKDSFIFARTLPTTLSKEQSTDIYDCATKGIGALGIRSCPAHVELIMTKKGARLVEIGARLGGYRPMMYELAYGIDILQGALSTYEGKTPSFYPLYDHATAVIESFPKSNGVMIGIDGVGDINTLPSFRSMKFSKQPGEPTGRAADGYKAAAYIVLASTSETTVRTDTAAIRNCLNVRLA